MSNEEIIRMANDVGIKGPAPARQGFKMYANPDRLKRFAALIAQQEREKVARWHIGSGYTTGHGDTIEDLLVELEWQVRESEREACAKLCEEYAVGLERNYSEIIADKIRARGQA